MKSKHETVEEALASAPAEALPLLKKIRSLALKAAPKTLSVEERISYGMPTVFVDGRVLLYYAAFKDHVGVFPPPRGDAAFMTMIAPYAGPKGNLSFPHGTKVPDLLLKAVVAARLAAVLDPKTTKVKAKVKVPAKDGAADSFARRTRWPMPAFVRKALTQGGLMAAYRERPPYQQNDYIGWIIHAKTHATQFNRLAQMLEELERGGVYMKMKHAASARPKG